MSIKNNNGAYKKGITGLLLTLNDVHTCDKSAQIEEIARSDNSNYYVSITADVHTHAPAPSTTYWFSFDLIDGDMTPETVHIYVDTAISTVDFLVPSTQGAQSVGGLPGVIMSVENKLKPDIEWY
jgi:hypothetical protein